MLFRRTSSCVFAFLVSSDRIETSFVERRPSLGFVKMWRASFSQARTPMEKPLPLLAPNIVQKHAIHGPITKPFFLTYDITQFGIWNRISIHDNVQPTENCEIV